MSAFYINPNDTNSLTHHLTQIELNKEIKSVLFLMAFENHYRKELLDPILTNFKKTLIGGVFPELMFKGERKNSGILLMPLTFDLKTQVFDLSETSGDFLLQLENNQNKSLSPSSTLFVFTDALSLNKELFIESLFNFFGIIPTYIGGGAGSLKFEQFPCIITNKGIRENAAVIGLANIKITLGVAHGWHSIYKSLKVTKAYRNQLVSLNWEPAYKVYTSIVESHSGLKFTEDNFFQIAKSYPLGIAKIDAEMVVRDPIMAEGDTLHIVDQISEGEYIHILHGNIDSLLEGAAKAKEIAFSKSTGEISKKTVFCIDCISRVLFMQDAFKRELKIIGQNTEVNGVLTLGEIANSGESFLEIYNKTIVVGIW